MPAVPGSSQPLSIMSGGGSRGKGKAKPKAKPKAGSGTGRADEDAGSPKIPKKRKGDDELHQIDLKRQQVVMKSNFAPRIKPSMLSSKLDVGCCTVFVRHQVFDFQSGCVLFFLRSISLVKSN